MSYKITYRPLCCVFIYHEYFLNDGDDLFTDLDTTKRLERIHISNYNFSEVFEIVPCKETEQVLHGHQIKWKLQNDRLLLLMRMDNKVASETVPFVTLSESCVFKFLIRLKDSYFENYSATNKPKKQIFLFTNKNNSGQAGLSLMPLAASNSRINGTFILDEVHSTEQIKKLDTSEQNGLLGIIELHALSNNNNLSLLNTSGSIHLKASTPEFVLLFQNKSTFWRYLNAQDQSQIFTTPQQHPLTKFGKINIIHFTKTYPNPGPNIVIQDLNDNKAYSITYI